jgi:hypothetical protein
MYMSNDYIPESDRKFLVWVKNLFINVVLHATEWNLNPAGWSAIDPPMIMAYENALTKAEDPNRGKADVRAKNEARDALKKATRKYVKEHLEYNSAITNEDRGMGLPVHDTQPTRVRIPDTLPLPTVKYASAGALEFHVIDSASGRKAKPAGVQGFEMSWVISDTPPADWSQLAHSSFCTRTPLRLSFSGNERGKTLFFATRWENTRGEKGPWSEIMSVIIP